MTRALRFSALVVLLASPTMPGAMQTAVRPEPGRLAAGLQRVAPQPPRRARGELEPRRRAGAAALCRRDRPGRAEPAKAIRPDRLRAAIAGGNEAQLNSVASPIFMQLAADLSRRRGARPCPGRLAHDLCRARQAGQQRLMEQVLRGGGGVGAALDSLLPTHAQYGFLKRALANTPAEDEARRDLIRTNMERWRWLPRNLGARHVLVNVPAFTAALVDNGNVTARHRTVVGARRTPTPQLNATITAVTINPWWNVPQSIIRENGGSFGAGYQVTRGAGGGISVRQPPGPRNALGRVKIEMPNEHAIYLHDTPSQSLFGRPVRAFSHGCIRTQNVRDFAARLLAPTGEWNRAAIDQGVAAGRTRTVSLAQPIPVYIAYFTAAATGDGNIVTYGDIYGRDAPVRQALARADFPAGRRQLRNSRQAAFVVRLGVVQPGVSPWPQHRSYWNATARGPRFPALSGTIEADVAVIGGGIVGVSTARMLKDRGLKVALVEARADRRGGDRQVDRQDHLAAQYRLHDHREEVRHGRRAGLCRSERGRPPRHRRLRRAASRSIAASCASPPSPTRATRTRSRGSRRRSRSRGGSALPPA